MPGVAGLMAVLTRVIFYLHITLKKVFIFLAGYIYNIEAAAFIIYH
jgi:hypothetical protein